MPPARLSFHLPIIVISTFGFDDATSDDIYRPIHTPALMRRLRCATRATRAASGSIYELTPDIYRYHVIRFIGSVCALMYRWMIASIARLKLYRQKYDKRHARGPPPYERVSFDTPSILFSCNARKIKLFLAARRRLSRKPLTRVI